MAVRIAICSEDDVYLALSSIRNLMAPLSFSEMSKQKVLVSVSELTRNVLDHANAKGMFQGELLKNGVCITVTDEGPGISDIKKATEGRNFSPKRGLGMGLAGVMRLMDEVHIETGKGGTKVIAIKWKETKYHSG